MEKNALSIYVAAGESDFVSALFDASGTEPGQVWTADVMFTAQPNISTATVESIERLPGQTRVWFKETGTWLEPYDICFAKKMKAPKLKKQTVHDRLRRGAVNAVRFVKNESIADTNNTQRMWKVLSIGNVLTFVQVGQSCVVRSLTLIASYFSDLLVS